MMNVAAPLPPQTRIQHVHLRVKDLRNVRPFYEHRLGFRAVNDDGLTVALSATGQPPAQVLLTEDRDAAPRPPRTTGLFHVAIRFPNRVELAKAVLRLAQHGHPIHGASDHLVSEAIYLADPEGNGIELYCDRPKSEWIWSNGEIAMGTEPLDVAALLKEGEGKPWTEIHPLTDIGHIHLNVGSLASAEEFYSKKLGFDVTTRSYPGALFMSAGGYHHHVGANIWAGRNAPRPPENSLGLIGFGIAVPNATPQTLTDADGVRVEVRGSEGVGDNV